MRVILAAGGTAGHINPALAVAQYVREHDQNSEILYVGAVGGMAENLVAASGFDFKGIKISGFSRRVSLESLKKNIVTVKRIITSSNESKRIIKDLDKVLNKGGYIFFEIGYDQKEDIEKICKEYLNEYTFECFKDINGKDRIVKINIL